MLLHKQKDDLLNDNDLDNQLTGQQPVKFGARNS